MLNTILELMKSWHMLFQLVFLAFVSGCLTMIVLGVLQIVVDITRNVVVLFRGYPPVYTDEPTVEETDSEEGDKK